MFYLAVKKDQDSTGRQTFFSIRHWQPDVAPSSVAAISYARLDEGFTLDTDLKYKEVIRMHHTKRQLVGR